jgi:signal recognition particle receptor subunit beta
MYNATRQLVLKGVDGLVFVADSMPERFEENARAFRTMEENIERNQGLIDRLPLVLEYNKRDLPAAVPAERLEALLNTGMGRRPSFEAVASEGYNVFAVLNAVSQLILHRFYQVVGVEVRSRADHAEAGPGEQAESKREGAGGVSAAPVVAAGGLAR